VLIFEAVVGEEPLGFVGAPVAQVQPRARLPFYAAAGRHCLPFSLGVHRVVMLSSVSFSVTMTVSPWATQVLGSWVLLALSLAMTVGRRLHTRCWGGWSAQGSVALPFQK
jgi:hypothetical protein